MLYPLQAKSAFNFFAAEKRSEIQKANPTAGFGEVSKLVGAAFKNLNSDEKVKYDALAKQDKKRYEKEMVDYEPADDSDDDSDAGKNKGSKKMKKAAKDPNAPKVRSRTIFHHCVSIQLFY